MHGNREISAAPRSFKLEAGPSEAQSRTSDNYAVEESDRVAVR